MRKPTVSEWQAAYKQFPGIAVRQCSKAAKYGKMIIHPGNEQDYYCSYCRSPGSNHAIVDFPQKLAEGIAQ